MTRIPTTQALRALESFSRHGTVWKAAEELNVTRSAVSHQLRLLERDLGFALFNRVGTGIVLTRRGRAFANDVGGALSAIKSSVMRHADSALTGQLTISCVPGFAANWLNTKISRFRLACPDVSLSIVLPKALDDLSERDADVFIAFGDPSGAEGDVELLRDVAFTPLISPALLHRLGGLQAPEDVLRADLLHLADQSDWMAWLHRAGVTPASELSGIFYADMTLVYSAAINAQGIAMGDEFICHEAMAAGRLIRPFDLSFSPAKSYFLSVPAAKRNRANVMAFRNWILGELNQTPQASL